VRTDAEAEAIVAAANVLSVIDARSTLLEPSYDEAEQFLLQLPRIGPWSAAFILFRGLGRMERLAERSGPILAAARRVYGAKPERELRAIAESYGAWMGYWALYLRRG
jgi:DNA-3-methyladenine glycosylase II